MDHQERQVPKLKFPSLRKYLIKIHADLLNIDERIDRYSAYGPPTLSTLETMVLLLEDRRFLEHRGVDIRASLREILKAATFRKHGGASTIDMQFVRTVTGYKERTLRRKLYEIFLSVFIQFRYSKITILRSYLACAFFGSHLKGANAASRKMFYKLSSDLSESEAAVIASLLVYPRPLRPTDRWTSVVERRASYGQRLYIMHKKRFD